MASAIWHGLWAAPHGSGFGVKVSEVQDGSAIAILVCLSSCAFIYFDERPVA